MSHRLLHSLVFSSVLALEGTGCSTSHQAIPLSPDAGASAGDGGIPSVLTDAFVPESRDASVPPDAFVPTDDRFCEEGWPTTKATSCTEVEGMSFLRCCNSFALPDGGDECCLLDPPGSES